VNIVADENIDLQIVERLRAGGHDVLYIAELNPGVDDDTVLGHSHQRAAVLLTSDKDFGDLVLRRRLLHSGVVLLRLEGLTPEKEGDRGGGEAGRTRRGTGGEFAVLTEKTLRVRG
jgi:predicted nuclease of predicted toxin-antitoxin system